MKCVFVGAFAAFSVISVLPAFSAPISVDAFGDAWEIYNFRVVQGVRSWGEASDDIAFGLQNVVPNGYEGTTGTAEQNGLTLDLYFSPDTVQPNAFGGGIAYDPSFTGSWKVTLRNGSDTLTLDTPELGDAPIQGAVTALSMSGDQLAPTLSWTNPDELQEVQINIFDLENVNVGTGQPDRIYANRLGTGFDSFTIPEGLLEPDHLYSFGVETGTIRGSSAGTNPSGSSQSSAYLSSRYTFFDFSTGIVPPGPGVYLPVVDPNSGQPIFNFDNPVLAGLVSYYDPLVAIGYDYEIGEGNPFFQSVLLPDVGDGRFDLFLDSGTGYSLWDTLLAGVEYDFGLGGVSKFRILGIETGAKLDPLDASAFVTGLSFVSDGRFSGTMRPISVEIATVPVPASFSAMIGALAGLMVLALRSRNSSVEA